MQTIIYLAHLLYELNSLVQIIEYLWIVSCQVIQGGSNMTGIDLYVKKPVTVPVIFEPPCTLSYRISDLKGML